MNWAAIAQTVAGWVERSTRDAKVKADIEAGEAFLAFYPVLKNALSSPEGQNFMSAIAKAATVNAASKPIANPVVATPDKATLGGHWEYTSGGSHWVDG
jgi:hypothetical protein